MMLNKFTVSSIKFTLFIKLLYDLEYWTLVGLKIKDYKITDF